MQSRALLVECSLEAVDTAMADLCAFAADALPIEGMIRLEIAVTEAMTNIVLHGDLPAESTIDLLVRKAPEQVDVEIRDPGPPIPPNLLQSSPDIADVDPLEESGRGIPLIKALSDALDYRSAGRSNCMTLRFTVRGVE
ncbi:ATP-binding protein [Paracoccus rhizosphaerae]|uniref:ATP-binding protein n=1 Tax=Paracoccus rhizosphaerae TaxID=1133347 RepID=A0ABV6CFB3_9RHOB|nr:ATP-binding protein [Paracoccus rhizosphaerae]